MWVGLTGCAYCQSNVGGAIWVRPALLTVGDRLVIMRQVPVKPNEVRWVILG